MELQRHLSDFRAAGVRLFAISNDPQEVLAAFATEFGIEYPLLSDAGSDFIQELGILNTLIDPDETVYGIAYPGVFVIDRDRRVTQKLFHRLYTERDASARLLRLAFGEAPRLEDTQSVSEDADDVRISVELATRSFVFMQLTELYVHFTLPDGLHVNGAPTPGGYIPTTVAVSGPDGLEVGAPEYPQTHSFSIAGLPEPLSVFDGNARVVVPLRWSVREGETVPLDVAVRFQACSDRECLLPRTVRLHLDAAVEGLNTRPRPS